MTTRDWKTFTDVTGSLTFPGDSRHGTVVKIPGAASDALEGDEPGH
jgi:hypothetical protein